MQKDSVLQATSFGANPLKVDFDVMQTYWLLVLLDSTVFLE